MMFCPSLMRQSPRGTPGEATNRIPAAMAAATASGLNAALTPGGATRPFTRLATSTRPCAWPQAGQPAHAHRLPDQEAGPGDVQGQGR